MLNFKGRHGSVTDNTVHSVQMDNTVHQDNMGWHHLTVAIQEKKKEEEGREK